VDARVVTRRIRELVWPTLRADGFEDFTGRTAWRDVGDDVDVVNFQSFGASIADTLGCTTFSFGVNLGVWLSEDLVPEGLSVKRGANGRLRPQGYQCAHRRELEKSLEQPWFEPFAADTGRWLRSLRRHREGLEKVMRHDRHDREDIWFVLPDGSNLDDCLEDALRAIGADGLRWLEATRRDRHAPAGPPARAEALRQALRQGPRR
jgi:hypothetical protein